MFILPLFLHSFHRIWFCRSISRYSPLNLVNDSLHSFLHILEMCVWICWLTLWQNKSFLHLQCSSTQNIIQSSVVSRFLWRPMVTILYDSSSWNNSLPPSDLGIYGRSTSTLEWCMQWQLIRLHELTSIRLISAMVKVRM